MYLKYKTYFSLIMSDLVNNVRSVFDFSVFKLTHNVIDQSSNNNGYKNIDKMNFHVIQLIKEINR